MPADQPDLPGLKEKQLNVAITAEMAATLAEIKKWHHYLPPQVARGLLEAACEFYDREKWFGFPIRFVVDSKKIPAQIVVMVPPRRVYQDSSDRNDPALNEAKGLDEFGKKARGRSKRNDGARPDDKPDTPPET